MKNFHRYIICFLCFLLLAVPCLGEGTDSGDAETSASTEEQTAASENSNTFPQLTCAHCYMADLGTGTVLYSKAETETAYPASLTKMMTILLAVEACERGDIDIDAPVTASETSLDGIDPLEAEVDLSIGEIRPLRQYLYMAGLSSSCPACNVIAEAVSGSQSAFVDLMNARAQELGCVNTHFSNSHGLHEDDHYSCAYDQFLIAKEALQHSLFIELCGTQSYELPASNMTEAHTIYNTNGLLSSESMYGSSYVYPQAYGIKTGYTQQAGYCLASAARSDNRDFLCIVMGCSSTAEADGSTTFNNFTDTIALYDWAFANFSYVSVFTTEELLAEVPVRDAAAGQNSVTVHPERDVAVLLPSDVDSSSLKHTIILTEENPKAPITAGQVLGSVQVLLNDTVIEEVPLVASVDVPYSFWTHMAASLSAFFTSTPMKVLYCILGLLLLLILFRYFHVQRRRVQRRKAREARRKKAARKNAASRSVQRDPSVSPQDFASFDPKRGKPTIVEPPETYRNQEQRDYYKDFFDQEDS